MSNPAFHETGERDFQALTRPLSRVSLGARVMIRLCVGSIVAIGILFVPAGTLRFWQAWVFLAIVFTVSTFSVFYLLRHDPQLVERRLQSKEKGSAQKRLVRLIVPVSLVAILLPGLDHRWGLSVAAFGGVPPWLVACGDVLLLGGQILIAYVLTVNSFASRTIQVESGQKVVCAGPYRIVRHPMYVGVLLMGFATPLALGSYIALPVSALLVPLYMLRLLNEEKVLRQELEGYSAYCDRTRFRLIPRIW